MTAPRQMTAKTLNALKGWPSQQAVDFVAPLSAAALALRDPILCGSCVHLNSDLEYDLGVGTTKVMPMFTFQNSDDPDVQNDGGDAETEEGIWVPISPSGGVMALVAAGAYELTSTEFVAGDYSPNDHLTSALAGGNAGKLAVGTCYTDTIVGVVSRGKIDNGYGKDCVAFWPWYIPPTA